MNDNTHHSGRADYDQLIQFRQLEPGEGYFFIRARDPVAGEAARAYAALALAAGAPPALVESALRQAEDLDRWPHKRLPNADHLSLADQQQLEYAFRTRAWRARDDAADLRIMLAEERAIAHVFGALRPILQQLLARLEPQDSGDLLFRLKRQTDDGREIEDAHPIEALGRWLETQGRLRILDPVMAAPGPMPEADADGQ